MKIGFVAPSSDEMQPFLKLLTDVNVSEKCGYTFVSGKFDGKRVNGVICGIGKVNAATATTILLQDFCPDCVIIGGVCGAIDDRLNVGDAILCTEVKHHDFLDRFLTHNAPYFESAIFYPDKIGLEKVKKEVEGKDFDFELYYGRLATGEQFVEDEGREEIKSTVNPLGVDMETAAFAQVCFVFDTPFLALRTVTDTPKERGISAFEKNLKRATQNQGVVLEYIFKAIAQK